MLIQLTPTKRLTSDSSCFKLERIVVTKGEAIWKPYRYYGKLSEALKCIPEQFLKETDATGHRDIIKALKGISESIENVINLNKG